MPRIHPKFKNEMVCPVCNCNFLPGVEGQTHCLGCNPNPQPVIPETYVGAGGDIGASTGKAKSCKKCGVLFNYTHPATKYCDKCKK